MSLTAPIGIFLSKAQGKYKAKHRLFITVEDLSTVPAELFATKVSKSQNQELKGKVIFKHFSYKANDNAPWSPHTPQGTELVTPNAELKQQAVDNLNNLPNAEFRLTINIPGKFCNIDTPDGRFTIFDKTEFPEKEGNPGYYLKSGSKCTINLTPAVHLDETYFQVKLSTDLTPDELFVKSGHAQVWSPDGSDNGFETNQDDGNEDVGPWGQ